MASVSQIAIDSHVRYLELQTNKLGVRTLAMWRLEKLSPQQGALLLTA